MATGQQTTAHDWQNFYVGHLTADITSSSTDIFIDTIPTPTESCLVIDPDTPANTEVIFYNSKTATKVTVPSVANGRGYDGSTAIAHLTGTKVILAPIGDDFRYIRTLATANATYLAAGGSFDFVASGAAITADAAGSTLLATMTSGTCYIGGSPVTIPASTSRTYTANSDTYVDVSSAGALVFTAVANNAASPALAASSIRLGIVVTGATTIAAATSINQGQESRVLPIASSIPYSVTDSLGNLIYPRDPQRKILGYRQRLTDFAPGTSAETLITGLNTPYIAPSGRKVKVTLSSYNTTATTTPVPRIYNGVFGSGGAQIMQNNQNSAGPTNMSVVFTPVAGSNTVTFTLGSVAGNTTLAAGATNPSYALVELE